MAARRLPLHEAVSQQIRELIATGRFGKDGRLPSEAELSKQLDVSRATLRQALWSLESEGLLVRQHGVGTFVQEQVAKIQAGIERLESFVETIRRSGYTPRVEHLNVKPRPMSATAARSLGVSTGTPGIFIDNLYFADEMPIVYSPTEIPTHYFGSTEEFVGSQWDSAREYMGSKGVKVSSVPLSVFAVPASAEVAAYLKVNKGFPLLLLEGPSYTAKGEAVMWTRAYFNTNLYNFTLVRR